MAIDRADWHWDSAEELYRKNRNITGDLTDEQEEIIWLFAGNHIGLFLRWIIEHGFEGEDVDEDECGKVRSGQMSGTARDCLSDAVKTFAKKTDENVKIGIVPFSSEVNTDMVSPLGASESELIETADALRASGGTNIYDAVKYANALFSSNENDLNIMILMCNGNDGIPSGEELEQLRADCVSRGITIYTVGLGSSVDAGLLEEYAVYGSGEYFYVNTPESIEAFYNYIYNISKNRYRIKYDAVGTYWVAQGLIHVRLNTKMRIMQR